MLFYSLAEPVTPSAGCEAGFVGTICAHGSNPPAGLTVDLGAGEDRLELDVAAEAAAAPTRITVATGAGDDLVGTVGASAEIDGGDGDDLIKPDERRALDFPPAPSPGGLIRGGAGIDTVDYEQALDPINVSLDGAANDGRPDEKDNVHPDVENVIGGGFGNRLTGSAVANLLTGGGGADWIAGGAGRDQLDGRSGNDTIDALDGAAGDRIECAEGEDIALVDGGDIAVEPTACEVVTWAPRLTSSTLHYRAGRIALTLSCPSAAKSCRGTVLLDLVGGKRKTLARGGYRIKRGKQATLRLKPTSAGGSALMGRTLKATAVVQPRGTTVGAGREVTIRP